jgi:UDP:flavonoid glycosyltransferase YjiC (YdhE family)
MSSRRPQETANLIVKALAQTGQRAVILSGWGGLLAEKLPETVLVIDSVPHDWLFERVAAVVHHGGAGTTSAGLRAGVPSIIIPFFADQPFWGQRVADLGVGPQPIARKHLTVERLAQAIMQAVEDSAMRQRAAALGAKIRVEDGIGKAVRVIESTEFFHH